jgi:hypothetical protein
MPLGGSAREIKRGSFNKSRNAFLIVALIAYRHTFRSGDS